MKVFSTKSGNRHILPKPGIAWLVLGSSAWLCSFQLSVHAQDTYLGPSILPPAPNAADGGNPFQGLGRSDDPGPSREKQFGFPTYNTSSFNANGMQDSPPPVINSDSYANYRNTDSTNSGTGGGAGSGGSSSQTGNSAPNSLPAGFIPTSMLDSPPIVPPTNAQAPAPPFKEQANAVPNLPSGFAGQGGFGNVLPSDSQNANGNSVRNINMESNFVNNVNTAAPTQTPVPPGSQQASAASSMSNFATLAPQQNTSMSAPQKSQSAKSDQPDSGSKSPFSTASIFDKDVSSGTADSSDASGAAGTFGTSGSSGSSKSAATGSANRAKSMSDNASDDDSNSNKSKLIPPPPATPLSLGGGAGTGGKAAMSSPLGAAVEQVRLGRLPDALTTINAVLRTDNENANAHYLKAVVSVLSRRFADARTEYLATLKYSHSAELSNRARIGLTKLTR
jgi:hypothetical protein